MNQTILKFLVYGNRVYKSTIGRVIGEKQYRIPTDLSIEQFLRKLEQQGINYVVLRWFEDLPSIEPGGDLDLLVADSDYKKLLSLLSYSRSGIGCDVYTQSVNGGGLYKNLTAYFSPALAQAILNSKTTLKNYISIPDKANYFHSLAYHAIYQKGLKSGLPTSIEGLSPLGRPAHDFRVILKQLAEAASIACDISMEALDEYLGSKGYRPSEETLSKLAKHNLWIQKRFFKEAQ